jgi:hypothetical protein
VLGRGIVLEAVAAEELLVLLEALVVRGRAHIRPEPESHLSTGLDTSELPEPTEFPNQLQRDDESSDAVD